MWFVGNVGKPCGSGYSVTEADVRGLTMMHPQPILGATASDGLWSGWAYTSYRISYNSSQTAADVPKRRIENECLPGQGIDGRIDKVYFSPEVGSLSLVIS